MNTKNSKTNEPRRFRLDPKKNIALVNLLHMEENKNRIKQQ